MVRVVNFTIKKENLVAVLKAMVCGGPGVMCPLDLPVHSSIFPTLALWLSAPHLQQRLAGESARSEQRPLYQCPHQLLLPHPVHASLPSLQPLQNVSFLLYLLDCFFSLKAFCWRWGWQGFKREKR